MSELTLTSAQRRELRGLAHDLDPVVMIGQHGLTAAVLHEIDNALSAHELIKVRVHGDDRDARTAMLGEICDKLSCAPVQQLGKLFILFRPVIELEEEDAPPPVRAARAAGVMPTPKKRATPPVERPRYSDFPKAPPRARNMPTTDTRPPRKRVRSERDDAWSDVSPRVRRRIDPNFVEGAARPPRARAPRPTGDRPPRSSEGRPPRSAEGRPPRTDTRRAPSTFGSSAPSSTTSRPPRSSNAVAAPTDRRRLRSDVNTRTGARTPDTATAATPTRPRSGSGDSERRFRWKDRDSWAPSERPPRPSTRGEAATSKRGAARLGKPKPGTRKKS